MKKENVYIIGNLIWIRIESNSTYGSKNTQYVLSSRDGGISLDAILTKKELIEQYPSGKFLNYINPSDTISFKDQ